MALFRLSVLVLACWAAPTLAADNTGRFAMKGAGILTCEIFMETRLEQSNIYYMIGGWIDGYLTAVNKQQEATYDITSFEKTELLAEIISNHCKDNPADRLFTVVNSVVEKLQADRLTMRSPMVPITVGEQRTSIYAATIGRIQLELQRRKLYSGEITGAYDAATQAAFKAFQASASLQATGFPDQVSLWKLIRREQ